ncbi:unnamed protein product [Fraxinus pennsylvanica]|uniref:Uncharacterized protein n=1 Tax=Fraxinus pennsylvanica TaxID=56036 RepID=A0AAD2AIE4_9LAMI|nr:unnamed protein product [Fraxinus pennsylvanica]
MGYSKQHFLLILVSFRISKAKLNTSVNELTGVDSFGGDEKFLLVAIALAKVEEAESCQTLLVFTLPAPCSTKLKKILDIFVLEFKSWLKWVLLFVLKYLIF